MGTWAGAIIETRGRSDFEALAAHHRIALTGPVMPWVLVQGQVGLGDLVPPPFAEALSRTLGGTVLAFFVQTTASVEELQHWDNGVLVRHLQYVGDGGGWVTSTGPQQAWEAAYFFDESASTRDDTAPWPTNLDDEIDDEDLARYERARAAKDASTILDLLSAGSVWQLRRVCDHFGLDPSKPSGRYTPPGRRWTPWLIVGAIVALLVGMTLLGALTRG